MQIASLAIAIEEDDRGRSTGTAGRQVKLVGGAARASAQVPMTMWARFGDAAL